MTIISQTLADMFQSPDELRVSNLKMSPSVIRTRLLPTTQLQQKRGQWSRVGNHHFFVHLTLPLRTNTNTISAHCISRNPDVSGLPPNILLKQNQKIMSTSNICIGKISRYFNRFIRLTFHREEFYSRTRKVHCF